MAARFEQKELLVAMGLCSRGTKVSCLKLAAELVVLCLFVLGIKSTQSEIASVVRAHPRSPIVVKGAYGC